MLSRLTAFALWATQGGGERAAGRREEAESTEPKDGRNIEGKNMETSSETSSGHQSSCLHFLRAWLLPVGQKSTRNSRGVDSFGKRIHSNFSEAA